MKDLLPAMDSHYLIRLLHLHCFIHMYRVYSSQNASDNFSLPRFNLFKPIKNLYSSKETSQSLFKNILFSFQREIIVGSILTLIFASCNLLVPQLLRAFLHFMHEHHVSGKEIISAQGFIEKFFIVQLLRIIFGEHAKRLFNELAIGIESSLAKKIIRKSLSFAKECRDRIPKSQIIQLQNVDLKLVFVLFKNLYMVIQAPFTILVAIILLFRENPTYGFIGIYWFVVMFLLQRELDGKMMHCNATKLRLIDERSKINYELFNKMKQSKLIHYQNLLIQKNNDLFIEENHDHYLFYLYSTLYDITLLILPIVVVVTISLFDMNNPDHITVQQVYVMLELLGICYGPMKQFRTISISLHDGLHSLGRLQKFFNLPDEIGSGLVHQGGEPGELYIQPGTVGLHPHQTSDFQIRITEGIYLKAGGRLIVLGKKAQGKSSFIKMMLGFMKKDPNNPNGSIHINGKIAVSLHEEFMMQASIKENILFGVSKNYSLKEALAQELYKELGLDVDFMFKKGIDTIVDRKAFTKLQLKKISIARAIVSDPNYYIFENPFDLLDENTGKIVQKLLRKQQGKGKTVILTEASLKYSEQTDHLVIFEEGVTKEFGTFSNLLLKKDSQNEDKSILSNFLKQNLNTKEPGSANKIIHKFKSRLTSALTYNSIGMPASPFDDNTSVDGGDSASQKSRHKKNLAMSPTLKYKSTQLLKGKRSAKKRNSEVKFEQFWEYFTFYIRSCPFSEFIYLRTFC